MREEEIESLVKSWLGGDPDYALYDVCSDDPETAWAFILKVLQENLTREQKALLAAGPLEDLLALHGATFIGRVEIEAIRNPQFSHLLGGVWRHEMPQKIWDRVLQVRKPLE
jgi:hypothetical protein